jgi:hydroxymethylpyrimidine kinase/phosphomethylpyrimidine kinase
VTPIVCTVGTTDPWNAAGLGLDVRALAECGARAVTVVAGVSAQDAQGLSALHAIPDAVIAAQFASLRSLPIAAYRIGALPESAIATVAAGVQDVRVPVVYDPVLRASAGGGFVDEAALTAIVRELIGRATIVTPNLDEARRLARLERCDDLETMREAAQKLVGFGAGAALVTGGRRGQNAFDVYFDGAFEVFEHAAVSTTMRGTGCLLSDAVAAALARGENARAAIVTARAYVRRKLESARDLGSMRVAD